MDDSNSNISSGSSTVDEVSNKSSEEPVNSSSMGIVQQMNSNIGTITTSTSFSNSDVDNFATSTSFQGISSGTGASSVTGSQSRDSSLDGDHSLDTVFHTKRKLHGKDKKVCRVCGDKALGYNFNAMTCESCKAFFRRNALKQSTPNCMFQGNCVVDTRTRRFCPHCRLKKCFSMGMKKEMILDQSRLRMRKRPNTHRRKANTSASQPKPFVSGNNEENSISYGRDESNETLIVAHVNNLYPWTNTPDLHTVEENPFKSCNPYRRLTEKEKACLADLEKKYVAAMETMIAGFSESLDEVKDFLNTSMIWAKKLVTYVKSVDDFKQLSKDAQVMSIKSCVRSSLTLIGAYRLDVSKNAYFIQGIYVGVDMFMRAFSSHKEVAELFVSTCFSMTDSWYKDSYLHALFHLILLFSPDGDGLLQCELMSDLQNKYLILLKHYLESKYSYDKSKEYFALILKRSRELRMLSIAFTEVLVDTDPQQIDPLTKEVFDFENIFLTPHTSPLTC